MPSPNIPDLTKVRQDLPLPESRIGALEPSLYGTIIHAYEYATLSFMLMQWLRIHFTILLWSKVKMKIRNNENTKI